MKLLKNSLFTYLILFAISMLTASPEELNNQIIQATKKGDLAAVNSLLLSGADVNTESRGYTPLMIAAKEGFTDIAKTLIAAGADVNAIGWVDNSRRDFDDTINTTALLEAALKGHTAIVKALIAAKADVMFASKYGNTALACACSGGHTKTIQALLRTEAGKNQAHLNEAFIQAAYQGHANVAQTLIANVDTTTKNKVLLDAARTSKIEIIKMLLRSGADVNTQNICSETPLIIAANRKNTQVMVTLLAAGADVNAKNHISRTALMNAASSGCVENVEMLIEMDADVTIKDWQGYTALNFAQWERNTHVINTLKKEKPTGLSNWLTGWRFKIWLASMGIDY